MNHNRIDRILKETLFCVILAVLLFVPWQRCQAQAKQYGILIAGKDGGYTFYDLNLADGNQCIEVAGQKSVMLPLKKVCSYFPQLSYNYDFTTRTAVIVNQATGRKMKLTEGAKHGFLYGKGSNKGKKITFSKASYISKDSKALMVHCASLKYILKDASGYQYYTQKAMKAAGYDCSLYQGILVYNQYRKVKSLPEAVKVRFVSQKLAGNVVKVTIPEGYSVAQTVNRLTESGICVSSEALYQAMKNINLKEYAMFDGRKAGEQVCFLLEGYLYPDTYEFYRNSSPEEVLRSILKHSDAKLSPYVKAAKKKGYELDELLSIASIIEKETGSSREMPKISSVLHTRLKRGMKIQCDCTIYYVERYIKPYITGDKNRYNAAYNTYKCKALPAGPICSPGERAIKAALNPDETEYLYFATDQEGVYYYASNDEEWLEMKEAIEQRNAELQAE